jgi:serine/threonine protein kinase
VRKQFHPDISRTSFEGELRNLCILSSAKHENIIQLLSAYIHKDSFNLIFPLASHGTLEDLFHSDVSSSATFMAPEFSMVMALSGLASALVTMHEFKLEAFHLIGCHRDLKPANILVDGDRLLLADFGLSRIAQGTSGSTAPPVASDFIAPEHEDRDFTRHRIGRASDIWALGCVLLMVLVFSLDGKPGLERLWVQRGTSWDHYAHRCFHDYSRRNLALEEPFQKLASHRSASVRCLLYLVKRMLIQEPRMRPKATTVDAHIKCTAIHLLSTAIDGAFKEACKSGYIHVHLESYRFRGWRSAVKINGSDAPEFHEGSLYAHYGEFKATLDHLEVLQKLLAGFSNGFINQGPRAFLPVKSRIDRLLGSLNDETRLDAVAYTEFMMLKSEKRSRFQDLHHLPEENIDDHIRSKITTRREILRPSQGDRYVDMYELTPRPEAHVLSKVELLGKGHSTPKLLLAEEASHRDPQKISSRLREIANLLSVSAKAGSFNVLRCCGYYHKPYEIRSGLLYELPSVEKVDLERIVTLREMLRNRTDTWCLGDRFILARGLANAVFELHSVSWLHRNITTSNIIFFHRGEGATVDAESFYFVGFAQSRSNRALTDSDGHASRAFDEDYYQHPDYLSKDQGYDEKHDYYSLGIVLLEIGLWQLCDDAVCVLRSDSSARDIAIQQLVPQLGPRVGSYYRDAVMACLDDTLTDTASLLQEQQLPLVFRTQVVERLSRDKCRA